MEAKEKAQEINIEARQIYLQKLNKGILDGKLEILEAN